ncbi:large ribosomal subunit protein uL1m [Eleutherodactylus coqui]|uniref:large ribosomal subunit protein uL1m n=1 Tax=Eleutherodactylus coqui TaxID=57060 RepID=UPI00346384CC
MAAPMCCLRTVIRGCQRHLVKQAGVISPASTIINRSWVAVRFYAAEPAVNRKVIKAKKTSKESGTKGQAAEKTKDTSGRKGPGFIASQPSDDVYIVRYYPRPTFELETAIEMLKTFQKLDFTSPVQAVFAELKLDMKLEKKSKVDPFVGYLQLPFPFVTELNKVLVFTENAEAAETAKQNGAAIVGGIELIPQVLNDEVNADFYIATPDIIAKLNVLKNKLRKKFPKSKRGSVGNDVANMIKIFETSHEYMVERECLVQTKIARLNMPSEHIAANLEALVKDVCKYKPLSFGPFVESVLISSATSEALYINCQKFFPEVVENINEE